MHRIILVIAVLLLPGTAFLTESTETLPTFSATGHFTSGIFNGAPIDIIESASLDQERIVLFFRWSNLTKKRYETKVRILDGYGNLLGEVENNFETDQDSYHTYYWYEPKHGDLPGDWVFEFYVDGEKRTEVRIPVSDAQ